MVDLTVLSISLHDADTPVLLLYDKGTGRILSMGIGPMEALAIGVALHRHPVPFEQAVCPPDGQGKLSRPLTYDLLLAIIGTLKGKFIAIDIVRIEQGAFIAEALLAAPDGTMRVNCRPSDGIALALRCGAAIRASEKILEHTEDIALVLSRLPQNVRSLIAARLAGLSREEKGSGAGLQAKDDKTQGEKTLEASLLSVLGGEDDTASPAQGGTADAEKDSGMSALCNLSFDTGRLIIKEKRQPQRKLSGNEALRGKSAPGIRAIPKQVRISLVQHGGKDDAGTFDEFIVPLASMSHEILTGLDSTPQGGRTGDEPDEERWMDLLRILTPGTKVRM